MYIKKNVSKQEYSIHKMVSEKINCIPTPKIYEYDEITKTLKMEKIPQMSISDMYGEKSDDVPSYIFDEIRKIIIKLNENNINYPDITGYNFIEYENKIYIIDFGDANIIEDKNQTISETSSIISPFVNDFINGLNQWNPDFR